MHVRTIARFNGLLILFLGLSMALPLVVSVTTNDGGAPALSTALAVTAVFGLLVFLGARNTKKPDLVLNHRDGVVIVTTGWLLAGFFGSLPYIFSGSIPGFTDACFESISGFTTTGATILTDIEALPRGILLWRSQTQWLGGMGIIVLSIAILPYLGVGGMQLYKAEIPSPVVDKLKPRISDTAKALWKIYLIISAIEIILLLLGRMNLFEAVCHTFSTMPTGGFSPKNASIAHYGNAYFDFVITAFMLIAGINFSLHYKAVKGNLKVFYKDPECKAFLIIVAIFIAMTAFDIHGSVYASLAESFRHAAFQVGSILTTTGFITQDYEKWPAFSQHILLVCMFLGGMAGSTGGGLKIMRVILLAKHGYKQIFGIIHPHAVTSVKLGGKPVSEEVIRSIWGFFILYLGLFVVSTLVMALLGLDFVSAFGSVIACISNVGPGFGIVGPVENYMGIPLIGKWVLMFCMLLGRLEIYTLLVLMVPEFWRK
ncbi:MAG: TrkH family potassium uptake protein [Desulfatiglandaceae bacterium]